MYYYDRQFWERTHSRRFKVLEEEYRALSALELERAGLKRYVQAQSEDIARFLQWHQSFSRLDYTARPFRYEVESKLEVDAWVDFSSDLQNTRVSLSTGLFFSTYDLMNRICCNKSVLSYCIHRGATVWHGTECFWPEDTWIPKIRFADYEPIPNPKFGLHTGNTHGSPLCLPHCAVPIGDRDRAYTASLMDFIGLTWVMFHEEAHYAHGHVHYLHEGNLGRIEEANASLDDDLLMKVFEWQADRNAILDMLIIFFEDRDDAPFELPEEFNTDNPLSWCIRLMICAIGAIILVFQKTKVIKGTQNHYPSTQCRMMTVLAIMYAKMQSIFYAKGHLMGLSSAEQVMEGISAGIVTGLADLLDIEQIVTNDVEFEQQVQRVVYEDVNPRSLDFLGKHEEIGKIMDGLNNCLTAPDEEVDRRWFEEYRLMLAKHELLFNSMLPMYRREAASGLDPLAGT